MRIPYSSQVEFLCDKKIAAQNSHVDLAFVWLYVFWEESEGTSVSLRIRRPYPGYPAVIPQLAVALTRFIFRAAKI